jgi:hypothetical protein
VVTHTKREKEALAKPMLYMPASKYYPLVTHIVRNTAGQPGPLLMIPFGPPGGGKTAGIAFAARSTGTEVFAPDPGRFESGTAGQPARYFRHLYEEAAQVVQGNHPTRSNGRKKPATIAIEDADKILGHYSDTHYTVNTQHLHGLIQALCDNPSRVFGCRMPRIPLFLSCNDLSVIPEPIRRHGRADLISWIWTHEERVQIVSAMYKQISTEDIESLVISHLSEPISFFADLRRHWIDKQNRRVLSAIKPHQALRMALQGKWEVSVTEPKAEDLAALAREVQTRRSPFYSEEDR